VPAPVAATSVSASPSPTSISPPKWINETAASGTLGSYWGRSRLIFRRCAPGHGHDDDEEED